MTNAPATILRMPPSLVAAKPAIRVRSTAITQLSAQIVSAPSRTVELVADFWDTYAGPLVEESSVLGRATLTFAWRDPDASRVLLIVNSVTREVSDSELERVAGTDIWWASFALEPTWRGSYAFLPLDSQGVTQLEGLTDRYAMRLIREAGQPDPFVADTVRGSMSVAHLPGAPAQTWLTPHHSSRPLEEYRAPGDRRVWVQEPLLPGSVAPSLLGTPDAEQTYPCVFVLDGEGWQSSQDFSHTVNNLTSAGQIPACYVVFLDAEGPRRIADLAIDGEASTYVAGDLLDWIRSHFAVSTDPKDIVIAGQSLGGLTALKTVFDHPDRVGAALSQSASLWQDNMMERAIAADPAASRFYLDIGTYGLSMLGQNQNLSAYLQERSFSITYAEYTGGHDYACWRGSIAQGLIALLGDK